MTRFWSAILLAVTVAVTGCMSGKSSDPASTATTEKKGQFGSYYYVNLFTPPVGGVIASSEAPTPRINCGASSLGTPTADVNGVLHYAPVYYAGNTSCGDGQGQTQYQWGDTVVLNAAARTGYTFYGWAGDCSGAGTCTLTAGADKTIVAVFTNGTSWDLAVSKMGSGKGTVTATIPGHTSVTCAANVQNCDLPVPISNPPLVATLAATPDAASHFTGWSGGLCSGKDPCSVTVDRAKSVVAAFDPGPEAFPVGGTVTGLLGSGFVLRDNAGDDLPVLASGSFSFTTLVAIGQPYAVTVAQQPINPSQNCVVTGGSGTIGAAPVTSVAVTCTTNVFAVSGAVTGLAGGGLVLSTPGQAPISVGTGANSFAFPTGIASGTAYGVSVVQNPTTPSQTCVVTNGIGIVTNAPVTNVTVTCTTDRYPIGGTISGLAGSLVTLRNNGGDELTIGGSDSFTFPTPLQSGAAYSVTVTQQPTNPSQTCVVSNGTGVVGSAPVTSVVVACATNTYTVSGTVSGLVGSGLVLRNNGGNDLAVSAVGSFTFSTPVASGTAYSVTVAQQPTNPDQTCAVSNGAGMVGGGAVTSLSVFCTTNPYSIGGTITGLSGSGLLLSTPGLATLSVLPGATTFTFSGRVAVGAAYAVTVDQQPGSPAQVCTVANGIGTAGGDVNNVAISCGSSWLSISGGGSHVAGIRSDGTLWAWGSNYYGEIGNGTLGTKVTSPVQIGTDSTWAFVSSGSAHTVAIRKDGTLWAWGADGSGELGIGTTATSVSAPTRVGTANNWASVSAGESHTVAVKIDGTLWAWGYNYYGQIGNGNSGTNVLSPVIIGADTNWTSASAGAHHTVAVKADGTLWAWGHDGTSATNVLSPVQVGADTNWASVSAGTDYTVALRTDGTLWAWGDNYYGQIGNGSSGSVVLTPFELSTDNNWASVSAGNRHAVAVKTDGTLWAWGYNSDGQVGNGSRAVATQPQPIGSGFRLPSAGSNYSLAVDSLGRLRTWGSNGQGQLGNGAATFSSIPKLLGGGFYDVAIGDSHVLAVKSDGTLWAWGNNVNGQLGDGSTTSSLFPTLIGLGFSRVFAGPTLSYGIKTDGTLWAWGYGSLGTGDYLRRLTPTYIGSGYTYVSTDGGNTLGVKSDGSLWGWGWNNCWELMSNGGGPTPVRIGSRFVMATVNNGHSEGVTNDGYLWAWGCGGFPNGTSGYYALPTSPVGTGMSAVYLGEYGQFGLALATSGWLYAWGRNAAGELGDGTTTYRSVAVSTMSGVLLAAAGYAHSVAVRSDYTLWSWGTNSAGELGDGTTTQRNIPTLVGTGFGWAAAGRQGTSAAVGVDGTLWVWGNNYDGQRGDGTAGYQATPALIP
jgi:alpha-tubulin suppressor-like RCC1 family protein